MKRYVIFICLFDLFDMGNYIYTFENMGQEVSGLKLNDGRKTIFVNTTGLRGKVSDEMISFLSYINGNAAPSRLTDEIDDMVCNAKYNFNWRQQLFTISKPHLSILRGGVLFHFITP